MRCLQNNFWILWSFESLGHATLDCILLFITIKDVVHHLLCILHYAINTIGKFNLATYNISECQIPNQTNISIDIHKSKSHITDPTNL